MTVFRESQSADTTTNNYCPFCSQPPYNFVVHNGKCPLIRSIEYYPDGSIKQIHFFGDADNPSNHVKSEIKYTQRSEG